MGYSVGGLGMVRIKKSSNEMLSSVQRFRLTRSSYSEL